VQPQVLTQYRLALFATVLALAVIMLGAYVRLSDAGLGCPDWPGCYGQIIVPSEAQELDQANQAYPQRPVEQSKAWKEMIHRYLAAALGNVVLLLALMSWLNRSETKQPVKHPLLLLLLVTFQALLGMWTVTLLVKPAIVTAHLIGGMSTAALLWLLCLRLNIYNNLNSSQPEIPNLNKLAWAGLIVLSLQIILGGWTSTNYAAIACISFPACYPDQWWPEMDFREAFIVWRELGINYEYGILEPAARTAIHMTHRLGALATLLYVGWLSSYLIRRSRTVEIKRMGWVISGLLLIQVALGVTNVLAALPLAIAVAHNGVAGLLLLAMVQLIWKIKQKPRLGQIHPIS